MENIWYVLVAVITFVFVILGVLTLISIFCISNLEEFFVSVSEGGFTFRGKFYDNKTVLKTLETTKSSQFLSEENCLICFESYKYNKNIIKMPNCRHFYHSECISEWIDASSSMRCPYCRAEIT